LPSWTRHGKSHVLVATTPDHDNTNKTRDDSLTSAAGIPKLQKISKTRLKFRGKGHEVRALTTRHSLRHRQLTINLAQFSDVALLLRTYQLWLDDLYPRAKFADGLAIVEKLGHKKSMQRLRSEWINENQPKVSVPSDSEPENLSATPANPGSEMVLAGANQGETNISPDSNTGVLSDAEVTERAQTNGEELSDSALGIPDEDELDQLLADEDTLGRNSFNPALASTELPSHTREDDAFADDGFDDEEDMMRDLGGW
jgi:replication fork protection complex subunit Csm3/Swi3